MKDGVERLKGQTKTKQETGFTMPIGVKMRAFGIGKEHRVGTIEKPRNIDDRITKQIKVRPQSVKGK